MPEPYSTGMNAACTGGFGRVGRGEGKRSRLHRGTSFVERELEVDVSKFTFFNYKLLVSRKKTPQLGDLLSIWKKSVYNSYLEDSNPQVDMDE